MSASRLRSSDGGRCLRTVRSSDGPISSSSIRGTCTTRSGNGATHDTRLPSRRLKQLGWFAPFSSSSSGSEQTTFLFAIGTAVVNTNITFESPIWSKPRCLKPGRQNAIYNRLFELATHLRSSIAARLVHARLSPNIGCGASLLKISGSCASKASTYPSTNQYFPPDRTVTPNPVKRDTTFE